MPCIIVTDDLLSRRGAENRANVFWLQGKCASSRMHNTLSLRQLGQVHALAGSQVVIA